MPTFLTKWSFESFGNICNETKHLKSWIEGTQRHHSYTHYTLLHALERDLLSQYSSKLLQLELFGNNDPDFLGLNMGTKILNILISLLKFIIEELGYIISKISQGVFQ